MSGAVFCKTAPLLDFRPLNLYRTYVRRRDLNDEIYLRFSASAQPDDFVIRLREADYAASQFFWFWIEISRIMWYNVKRQIGICEGEYELQGY